MVSTVELPLNAHVVLIGVKLLEPRNDCVLESRLTLVIVEF